MTPKPSRHDPVWWVEDDHVAEGGPWPLALSIAAIVLGLWLAQVSL